MRKTTIATVFATIPILAAAPAWAGPWDATIRLGGIIVDEVGDKSTVQETYNIYDGFSVSGLRFSGSPVDGHYVVLDFRNANLDSRQGEFLYRLPGRLQVDGSYDQHRQVFDPDRAVTSDRKNLQLGARWTPVKALRVSGFFSNNTRTGDRLPFPSGTVSSLGTAYDYSLNTAGVGAEVRKDGRGLAVDYRYSDLADDANVSADRTGQVVSARAYTKGFLYDRITHLVRASYGEQELADRELDYTLKTFQYTGTVQPEHRFLLKYNFNAQRVDSETTGLRTDRFLNLADATFFHEHGSVTGGYGYELNDDDRRLTSYHSWRAGAVFRNPVYLAKFDYSGRVKMDQEELTLLKDLEASRLKAGIEVKPLDGLALTGAFQIREREFPDIRVRSEGNVTRTSAEYRWSGWGSLSGQYAYARDEYKDLAAGFDVSSHVVTGRADVERIPRLLLSAGVSFVRVMRDLDIEKSILFFEGRFDVLDDLHVDAKYNVYNYDDYVLWDRYYTANVVWIDVSYDLHGE